MAKVERGVLDKMFKVGEYVVYGNSGVCKVVEVGPLDVGGISKDRLYYTLVPVDLKGSKVFTPVDNGKVIIRSIISETEAMDLIDDIKNVETILADDEKGREFIYKESLKTCDCRDLVKIIKTSYLRRQSRITDGKKAGITDDKYLKIAEDSLYGELAFILKKEKNEMKDFIAGRVEH